MTVFVSRRAPRSASLSSATVKRLAEKMLNTLSLEDSELSILLCDDDRIHRLNREHRGIDKPTDVLSFPQAEFIEPEVPVSAIAMILLGDVVISIDTAERQAASRHRPLVEEVRFLLAHGLLHLLGHDHANKEEKTVMTRRARALVRAATL